MPLPKRYVIDSVVIDEIFLFTNKGIKFELGTKRKSVLTHTAQFLVSGSLRIDMPGFTATSYPGQNITYYPWKDGEQYTGNLDVLVTALEPSLYVCMTKEGFTANQNLVTVPSTGIVTVETNVLVCGTKDVVADSVTYTAGTVFMTSGSTEVSSVPGSVLNLVTYT